MSKESVNGAAVRQLAAELVAALQQHADRVPELREAVVAAVAQAFAPDELQELVAELVSRQRAVCDAERHAQLVAAAGERAAGNLAQAGERARAAVRLDFTDAEAHRVLAEVLEQAGDPATAHTEYLLAMHLGWDGADADAAIARTTRGPDPKEGQTSPADRRYREALGRGLDSLEQRDLREAQRHARSAVALDPTRPEGFNLLGIVAEAAGRRGEARRQYLVANQLAPTYRPALENLARSVRPWPERGRPAW